jgi:hypothetical protein
MMMRQQEALWLLLPGCEALWQVVRGPERRRWLAAGVLLTLSAFIAFVPQMLVWWYYTGSPLVAPQVEPLRLSTPFVIVSLFSTRGGLFPWSPIAYAALVGLVVVDRRVRVLAWALVAVFALEVYVVSSAWVVTGGYGYGARRLSDGAVLIGLGVACVWAWLSRDGRGARLGRRLLAGFSALCLLLNIGAMELLRARRIASSGAYARTAEHFLGEVGAPPSLARLFRVVGYPFVQPVGWLFALRHHTSASTFEGVVGNWFLDRDGQWFQVQSRTLPLEEGTRVYVASGLELVGKAPARVTGPARLLLPMFAREPIVVHLVGAVPPGPRQARWNDATVPVVDEPGGVRLAVPGEAVEAGVNELSFSLPLGAILTRVEFDSTTQWWRK